MKTLTKAEQLSTYFELVDLGDRAFYALTKDAPEEVIDLVRELHEGEAPNDWRYTVIATLLEALAKGYELDQAIDDCIDLYNSDAVKWLEVLSRSSYIDQAEAEGLVPEDATIWTRIQLGQYVAISSIAARLLQECNL